MKEGDRRVRCEGRSRVRVVKCEKDLTGHEPGKVGSL